MKTLWLLLVAVLFVWMVPIMLVLGFLRPSRAARMGFVLRDFIKALNEL